MGVGQPDSYLLKLFGMHVRQGFGHTAYQVGSSLTQKRGWKDVDVRLILPDDEYIAYFGDPFSSAHNGLRLMMWCLAWTTLGRDMTRLPIDFQIQQVTLANAKFEGVRSALILTSDDLDIGAIVRTPSTTASAPTQTSVRQAQGADNAGESSTPSERRRS